MKKLRPILLICLAGIAVLVGCNREPHRKVTIGYLPIIANLPTEIARERGYFTGIDVEYRIYGSSNDLMEALHNGQVDATMTVAVAPVVGFHLKNPSADTVKIFSYSRTTADKPFDGLFVRDDGKINTFADLLGKRVGVFPGTTAKNILSVFLRKNGVDPSSVQWVLLPPNLQITRLRDGDIDALFTYETVRTVAELQGFKSLHRSVIASVFPDAPYGCSAINAKFANEFPKLTEKVVAALDKAILDVLNRPNDARDVLARKFELGRDIAAKCFLEERVVSTRIHEAQNIERFKGFLGILKEAGELDRDIDVNAVTEKLLWKKL